MLKKFNQHKKSLILQDRSLGQKTSWGIIWSKKSYEFGLIPASLPEYVDGDYDNCIAELSEFLQMSIKKIDRINEYYNLTYEPGEPTHIQQVRVRENRTFLSPKKYPTFEECWILITEVDREFCVIENLCTGETILTAKGKLNRLKVDEVAQLVLHWTECEVIASDRIRIGLDWLKQAKKEGNLSEGTVEKPEPSES